MECKHNFVTESLYIASASEAIDIEVCNICCFTKDELKLKQMQWVSVGNGTVVVVSELKRLLHDKNLLLEA